MQLATTIRASDNDFAMLVWCTIPQLTPYARRLWAGDDHGAEDGLQETVCRALAGRAKFDGGNLAGWLTRMMRNIRCDQLAKGYGKDRRNPKKSKRPADDARGRMLFYSDYDVIEDMLNPMIDRCDPESILIAVEEANVLHPR